MNVENSQLSSVSKKELQQMIEQYVSLQQKEKEAVHRKIEEIKRSGGIYLLVFSLAGFVIGFALASILS